MQFVAMRGTHSWRGWAGLSAIVDHGREHVREGNAVSTFISERPQVGTDGFLQPYVL